MRHSFFQWCPWFSISSHYSMLWLFLLQITEERTLIFCGGDRYWVKWSVGVQSMNTAHPFCRLQWWAERECMTQPFRVQRRLVQAQSFMFVILTYRKTVISPVMTRIMRAIHSTWETAVFTSIGLPWTKRGYSIYPCLNAWQSGRNAQPWMVINPTPYHRLDVMSFYARNKEKLLVKCTDNRIYSHCQEYYLLQVHTDADMCSSYAPTPCISFPQKLTTRHSQRRFHGSHTGEPTIVFLWLLSQHVDTLALIGSPIFSSDGRGP